MWARATLSVAVIAVSVLVGIGLVAKIAKPYREAGRQEVQLAQTLQQSDALAAQNAQLERRIAYLKTPDGIASEARRMGYLRPGEFPIVVEGMPAQTEPGALPTETVPAAPVTGPQVSPMRRFWRHLSGQ